MQKALKNSSGEKRSTIKYSLKITQFPGQKCRHIEHRAEEVCPSSGNMGRKPETKTLGSLSSASINCNRSTEHNLYQLTICPRSMLSEAKESGRQPSQARVKKNYRKPRIVGLERTSCSHLVQPPGLRQDQLNLDYLWPVFL